MPLSMAIAVLSSQLITSVVDRAPNLDIRLNCDHSRIRHCLTHEQAARDKLHELWPSLTRPEKVSCAKEAKHAGHPSYAIWLTCLRRHTSKGIS
jgi:hypothetical protein